MRPDDSTPSPSHLPAPVCSPIALLQRTQGTLGLLREVVQESSAEYWYERGKKAAAREEWEEAELAFRACILRDSDHWRATLQLALTLTYKNSGVAAKILCQAYDLPYLKWEVWETELTIKEWQTLRICFECYREEFPNDNRNLMALSLTYHTIGSPGFLELEALEIMGEMCLTSIHDAPAYYRLLGSIWVRIGIGMPSDEPFFSKYMNAFATCAVVSNSASNFFSLAVATERFFSGFSVDYVYYYEKSLLLNCNHVQANFKLGEYYYEDYPAKSLIYFERVTKIAPDFLIAFLALSNCQERIGNKEAAIMNCKSALAIDPFLIMNASCEHYDVRNILSTSDLIAVYDRIIESNPSNAAAFRERGVLKFNLNDWAGGGADCRRYKELSGTA